MNINYSTQSQRRHSEHIDPFLQKYSKWISDAESFKLRTFARKSSHIEICFISRLKLGHKLLISKRRGGGGVTDFVSEKKARENALISIDRSS